MNGINSLSTLEIFGVSISFMDIIITLSTNTELKNLIIGDVNLAGFDEGENIQEFLGLLRYLCIMGRLHDD